MTGNGIGFMGMLALIFIFLKLSDHIDWAWIWVLSPLWIPAAIVLTIWAIILCVAAIAVKLGR